MPGYILKNGIYQTPESGFDRVFDLIFSPQSKTTTSYKFVLLSAILNNIFNADAQLRLPLRTLFDHFAEAFWNLSIRQGLYQIGSGRQTAIRKVLETHRLTHGIAKDVAFENIPNRDAVVDKVLKEGRRYVLGALFGDSDGSLYSFSKDWDYIQLNPDFYDYARFHRLAIMDRNNYAWARYLEAANPASQCGHILTHLDFANKRQNLTIYRSVLQAYRDTCFYCGASRTRTWEVDHFVPWSFVKDDRIWNMALACRTCNNTKRDRIPPEPYFDRLREQNDRLPTVLYDSHGNAMRVKEQFATYRTDRLTELYDTALRHLRVWEPSRG